MIEMRTNLLGLGPCNWLALYKQLKNEIGRNVQMSLSTSASFGSTLIS